MANYKKYFENLPKLAYHSRVLVLANIEPSSHHCFFAFCTRLRFAPVAPQFWHTNKSTT